jgi:hypothetical protein
MSDAPKKHLLVDTGTRFDHLSDLQDIWGNGLQAVTNSLNKFPNKKDEERKASLEAALSLLSAYRDRLADYDTQQWKMREEICRIPLTKWREKEAKNGSEAVPATPPAKATPVDGDDLEPQAA